jgi:hypothetical protein
MKYTLILAIACLLVSLAPASGQKIIEKNLSYTKGQKIDLNLRFGDRIQVNAWDKNEVYIKAEVFINSGKLNDALLLTFNSSQTEISVDADFDKEQLKKGKREDCPPSDDGSFRGYYDGKNYVCSEITYQVFLPKGADLRMETISANIELKDLTGPVFAKSISGFVDMSWPAGKGASVSMKSITGELYSDLDIAYLNKKDKPQHVGYLLKGTVNGGGPEVYLESISNDIYLRKAGK